ncbi:DUF4062 domain-containing protein [Bacillus thuringiensis]|uniref:hypothetical protein n=1 Tax=Bacillus cereus group TaxID=86661 RepID=UPI0007FB2DFF|nr:MULTISPECIES: hypothetical protein [Bacillus cereus group]MCP1399491.1 hypothetical protein [Bacillus cereus]OBW85362.1 hypothetical protein A9L49_28245 [Bacillus cereus]PEA15237.1 DUF4062 domain-containing protein [Bacillus thuringiensis]PER53175.1 DUF4062 domain-containing protein [Bacillus thuringiensis]PFF67884.1 DUF4062 domain-containing protein [Bacillus thuringiensis]
MSYNANVYRVLIASPSDVSKERELIPEVINKWNTVHSEEKKVVLLPVKWETHSTPQMGSRPQEIINNQIIRNTDILVGVFWTKLGTPTGVKESGTVEEISQFIDAEKPTLLYFSEMPVVMNSIDLGQYARLQEFKETCYKQGLVRSYDNINEFTELLSNHLTSTVRELSGDLTEIEAKASNNQLLNFEKVLKRYETEWRFERDNSPVNINEGKRILGRMYNELLAMSVEGLYEEELEKRSHLNGSLTKIKGLEKHQLYLDGGESYREFWRLGDSMFENLREGTLS